jgi:hypothetical protein
MSKLQGLVAIVSELRVEKANLVNQLKHVDAALSVLGKLGGGTSFTELRQGFSASARKKMSLTRKIRRPKEDGGSGKKKLKRTMSASARRKIAAAQRARWAKVRAGKKAA